MDNRLINLIEPIRDYVLLNPNLSILIDKKGVEIKQVIENYDPKEEIVKEMVYGDLGEPTLLGIQELSEKIGIGREKLSKLSKIKGFPVIKVGNRNKYILSKVMQWFAENKGVKVWKQKQKKE